MSRINEKVLSEFANDPKNRIKFTMCNFNAVKVQKKFGGIIMQGKADYILTDSNRQEKTNGHLWNIIEGQLVDIYNYVENKECHYFNHNGSAINHDIQINRFQSRFCYINYRKDIDAVICTWKQFCQGENYRNPLYHGLDILQVTNCQNWVTDTTNGFESTPEDTQWLLETFIPETLSSNCKNLFFIMAPNSPLKHEIENQAETLRQFFTVHICENIREIQARILKK